MTISLASSPVYQSRIHHAALNYASAGKPIFPVWGIDHIGRCCCRDPACKHPGKHPNGVLGPKGKNSATTDPQVIQDWFTTAPLSNIGMPTGEESGVVVLDVDAQHGGWESIDELERRYGDLPATLVVMSGGGGLHVYFRNPQAHTVRTSTALIGPGLDIRAQGGSIMLPPSVHVSGRRYEWAELTRDGVGPDKTIAEMPPWLLTLASKPAQSVPPNGSFPTNTLKGTVPGRNDSEGPIAAGQRNATLASKGGSMRRAGFSEMEILAALLQVNGDRCSPPLPEREVRAIATSVSRYVPQAPAPRFAGHEFRGFSVVDGQVVG